MSDTDTIQKLSEALEAEKVKNVDLNESTQAAIAECKKMQGTIDSIVPPEAVYSFSTTALNKDGMGATWTIRARVGEEGKQFFHRADNFLQYAIQHGWTLPQRAPAPASAPQPAPTSGAPAPANGNGVMHAILMKVGKSYKGEKPQLAFDCQEQADPLKFTGKVIGDLVQFLRPVGAYTEAQLTDGAKFTVNYLVDWELSNPTESGKRYQNIVKLRLN